MQNLQPGLMKIDQSAFVRDFIQEEGISDCNLVNILMKVGNFIDMQEVDDYKNVDLKTYQ